VGAHIPSGNMQPLDLGIGFHSKKYKK